MTRFTSNAEIEHIGRRLLQIGLVLRGGPPCLGRAGSASAAVLAALFCYRGITGRTIREAAIEL
jgi:hypothetical protein